MKEFFSDCQKAFQRWISNLEDKQICLLTVECDSCLAVIPGAPAEICADIMGRCPRTHVRVHFLSSASNVHFAFSADSGRETRDLSNVRCVLRNCREKPTLGSAEWRWGHGEQSCGALLPLAWGCEMIPNASQPVSKLICILVPCWCN